MHRVPGLTKAVNLMVGLIATVLLFGCTSMRSANQNSPKIYVDVTGSGKDHSAALAEAFRNAVREASGILISSKLELANEAIVKDVVSEFSAGYISSYEVKKTYLNNGTSYVEIGALVSSSKLLGEYLFDRPSAGKIQGDQLYARTSTYLRSKEQGDRFLQHLAEQYPSKALATTLGSVSSTVSENREIWLIIPYRVTWAKGYLDAFEETVGHVSQSRCITGTDKQPRRCDYNVGIFDGDPDITWGKGYSINDRAQLQILISKFRDSVGFLILLLASDGGEVGRLCHRGILNARFLVNDEDRLSLSNTVIEGRLNLKLNNPQLLHNISSASLSVIDDCT